MSRYGIVRRPAPSWATTGDLRVSVCCPGIEPASGVGRPDMALELLGVMQQKGEKGKQPDKALELL